MAFLDKHKKFIFILFFVCPLFVFAQKNHNYLRAQDKFVKAQCDTGEKFIFNPSTRGIRFFCIDSSFKPIDSVVIEIYKGSTLIGSGITKRDGKCSFPNIPDTTYNQIVVYKGLGFQFDQMCGTSLAEKKYLVFGPGTTKPAPRHKKKGVQIVPHNN